ncbi:transposase [Streptomyces sp. NPDC006134]|uniref:transposase n=1 Tax=Streptomyces sp. NPDC006134 TaxID=3154467 RepID=UPI0033D285C2
MVPPTAVIRPQGGGRRRAGDRACLAAIVFVAASGCTWRQLPLVFGPTWPTGYRCFAPWSRDRVWARPHQVVLDAFGARGGLGSKIHLITDRNGLPLSLGASGAYMHDSQSLELFVCGIPPIRSLRGARYRRPARPHADKGCDYGHQRRWPRERGIRHRIVRKGAESSQRLGRHRWVAERTVSWQAGCRRLHRRYGHEAERFLNFAGMAAALVGYRRPAALLTA